MAQSVYDDIVALVLQMAPEPLPPEADPGAADFVDDLGYHSVALVELGFAVEERFDLEPISAEDVEDVQTAKDLAEFVNRRLASE